MNWFASVYLLTRANRSGQAIPYVRESVDLLAYTLDDWGAYQVNFLVGDCQSRVKKASEGLSVETRSNTHISRLFDRDLACNCSTEK